MLRWLHIYTSMISLVIVLFFGVTGVTLNHDLHRGRDAGTAWAWVIDATGIFLALIGVPGLGLLVYLKKVRAKALLVMAAARELNYLRKIPLTDGRSRLTLLERQ